MNPAGLPELSESTSKRINWETIDDLFGIVGDRQRKATGPIDEPLAPEERERAKQAFGVVKEEFGKTIGWIRTTMRSAIVGIVVAVALAVAGGALLQVSPWARHIPRLAGFSFWPSAQGVRSSERSSVARIDSVTLRACT